jgi:glycerophosphoryl diester phosphodiesterase
MRALATLLLVAAAGLFGVAAPAGSSPTPCDQIPELDRWQDAGVPDEGAEDMRITVHRGAARLAPENTIPAFEYAIAYDLDMIEVDVQQTLDGRYVVFHDYDVEKKTDGSGLIPLMTYDEVKALNVADNQTWKGSEYDPSYMPDLEDVLAMASEHEVGINFDLKESVWNAAGVALLATRYPGVIERSIFQPYVPGRTEQIIAAAPEAKVMFNAQFDTPPALLYGAGAEYDWFGGELSLYPPEAIVAAHDACDFVQPNVYSDDKSAEAAELERARSIGADGAMVNNPDVAAAVLARPVSTSIEIEEEAACLLGHHGLGLPGKTLSIDGSAATTAKGGCVPLPSEWSSVTFEGDDSALAGSAEADTEHDDQPPTG